MDFKIVIAATFTARPLEESLAFWMEQIGIPTQLRFAPYAQVFQPLLDPTSRLAKNVEGVNVILIRAEDWAQTQSDENRDFVQRVEQNVADFIAALEGFRNSNETPCFICLCPASEAVVQDPQKAAVIARGTRQIAERAAGLREVHVLDGAAIGQTYQVAQVNDTRADEIGHIPYTPAFFGALGAAIAREIVALGVSPYRVLVLDADETLWEGVCGEDEVSLTREYLALQAFAVEQHTAGMQLCLCSKNNEADVLDVFRVQPEMQLRLSQLSSWRINWQPTSINLADLARELSVPLESLIYVSGNPVECTQVRALNPEILTLQLPADRAQIPTLLAHMWAFKTG